MGGVVAERSLLDQVSDLLEQALATGDVLERELLIEQASRLHRLAMQSEAPHLPEAPEAEV
jgi:hypothetical protein